MEIEIINYKENNGVWTVVWRYWVSGECACTSVQKTSELYQKPTKELLLTYI